jgi:spore coat protein H
MVRGAGILLTALALCGGLFGGCDLMRPQPLADGAIQTIRLEMGSERYEQLQRTGYLQKWYATTIVTDSTEQQARIRVHGNVARRLLKKNYKIQSFAYLQDEPTQSIVLSSQYLDASFCRSLLADYLFDKAGFLKPDLEPIQLYIDGVYQGLYLQIEDVDELFFARRCRPLSSLYKINLRGTFSSKNNLLASQAFSKQLPDDDESFVDLERLIAIIDAGITEQNRGTLESMLDITNALDYMLIASLIDHHDGIRNNFYLYFDPPIRKFIFIPWDMDQTFAGTHSELPLYTNGLFEQLRTVPSYNAYLNTRMKQLYDAQELQGVLDRWYTTLYPLHQNDPFGGDGGVAMHAAYEKIGTYLKAMQQVVDKGL